MRPLEIRNHFLQRKFFLFHPMYIFTCLFTSFFVKVFSQIEGFFFTICFWPWLDEHFWGNRMKPVGEIQLCSSSKHSLGLCCHCIKLFSLYLSAFSSCRDLSAWCVSCGKSLIFHLSVCFSVRWQAYLVFTLVSSSMLCSFCSFVSGCWVCFSFSGCGSDGIWDTGIFLFKFIKDLSWWYATGCKLRFLSVMSVL